MSAKIEVWMRAENKTEIRGRFTPEQVVKIAQLMLVWMREDLLQTEYATVDPLLLTFALL